MDNENGLPPGPLGSKFRRDLERERERIRQRRIRPETEKPEIAPADKRGLYRVWNCNTEYGPYGLATAKRVLVEWEQRLQVEASFRNQYRKTPAYRRLERHARKPRKAPQDLQDYTPIPKPKPRTRSMAAEWRGGPFTTRPLPTEWRRAPFTMRPLPTEWWGAPFTARPMVSQQDIEAHAKRERQAIRRHRTTKANREKQPKAALAANEARSQAKAERKEKARAIWNQLSSQGVPKAQRCRIIATRLSVTVNTVRRYLK